MEIGIGGVVVNDVVVLIVGNILDGGYLLFCFISLVVFHFFIWLIFRNITGIRSDLFLFKGLLFSFLVLNFPSFSLFYIFLLKDIYKLGVSVIIMFGHLYARFSRNFIRFTRYKLEI